MTDLLDTWSTIIRINQIFGLSESSPLDPCKTVRIAVLTPVSPNPYLKATL